MSLRQLIDDAAYESGRDEYSSAEMDALISWFNRFYKSLMETHKFIYSYTVKSNLVAQASDNPLFSYAYQIPADVLKIEKVKSVGEDGEGGAGWGQPNWVQYGGALYSKAAVEAILVKFLPEVSFTPNTLQEALMYRIAAKMSQYGEREPRAASRQMRMYKEKIAGEIRRNTVPKNVTEATFVAYLKQVGQILGFGGHYGY